MSRKIEVDTKTFIKFWLVILAFVLAGLFIVKAWGGLLIVLIAAFFAIALKPLANKIDQLDKRKQRSSLSSIVAVVLVVLGVTAVVAFAAPVIVNETSRFVGQIPEILSSGLHSNTINNLGKMIGIDNLGEQAITALKDFSNGIVSNLSNLAMTSVTAVGGFLTSAVLTIVLTILFLLQGPALMDEFWAAMSGKNDKRTVVAKRIVDRMAGVVAKYVSGQLLVALIDGAVVATSIAVLSLIFGFSMGLAIPMGLIAVVLYMIPMFGPIITCVLVSLLLFISSPWSGLAFAIFYIIYEQIANNVISPKIQGKGMALPPLVILIAITIGMYTFGLIGTLVAIPIAGCIKVLVQEYPNLKALND
ncbi:AI-2E family transporter [Candidatus Saccharibacteria bacterium]|nr:AI-2E family transporter [Candidatus Saccharibacteria bacterium]